MFEDLKQRLLSRKFWVAVGSFVTFVATGYYNEAMWTVLGYLGIQTVVDVKNS